MSIHILNALYLHPERFPFSGGRLTVMTALASFCDRDGDELWPSPEAIAERARIHERNARKHLAELMKDGWVELVEPGGGAHNTNTYRIVVERLGLKAPDRERMERRRRRRKGGGSAHENPGGSAQVSEENPGGSAREKGGARAHENPGASAPQSSTSIQTRIQTDLLGGSASDPPDDVKQDLEAFEREFARLWVLYPRKLARKDALAAFQARRRGGTPVDALERAVKHYAQYVEGSGTDQRYVLRGATFFGPRERWMDFVDGVPEEHDRARRGERTGGRRPPRAKQVSETSTLRMG